MAHGRNVVQYNIQSLLSSSSRENLVRNNSDQVMIDNLKGKKIGLYFSASGCGPCERFTPILVEVYNEISSKGDFEVIFVSSDQDDDSFNMNFSKMPLLWHAIPFSDSDTRNRLDALFKVTGIPHLVIIDENGKLVTESGVEVFREYGVEGYPFTSERIRELNEEKEKARKNQSLRSILVSCSRDFVRTCYGKKVLVSELEGSTVGLYFSVFSYKLCDDFTPKLVDVYKKLKAEGENFEIVLLPLDDDEELFNQGLKHIPWLSLPFKDKSCEKLAGYFELSTLPTLVIIGPDGKTLQLNAAEAIEEHGIDAYPFTPEKFVELVEIEKTKEEARTLMSILISGDSVLGQDGVKIPVSEIRHNYIFLYISGHWSRQCHRFLPKLIKAYHDIKAKDGAFEIIYVSVDENQESFDEFFARMPWVALPFRDSRVPSLLRTLKVDRPMIVAIGPGGHIITKDAIYLVWLHGADGYPFTRKRLEELEAKYEEIAMGWPEKVVHAKHEHELVLARRRIYNCDGCHEEGRIWSYYCKDCDFDLHKKCAFEEDKQSREEVDNSEDE